MSYVRFVRLLAAFVLVAAAAPASSLLAADVAFDVRGRVIDSSGAVIVGASVTLRHAVSGAERHTITDAGGEFVFEELPPGRYTVKLENPERGLTLTKYVVIESGKVTRLYPNLEEDL